jgi:TonB-linked SusC/RagA family outer membrane protein
MVNAHDYIYYSRLGALVAERKIPGSSTALTTPSGWGTGNDLTENTGYTTQYLTPDNKFLLSEGWQSMPDPVDPSKTIIYKGTDWQDVLFRTGVSTNHHLGVEGGTQKATFHSSVGYMYDQGIAITTKYKQLSFDVGGKLQVKDNLSLSGEAMYSTSSDNHVYNITDVFFRSVGIPPTTKYKFQDGSLAPGVNNSLTNLAYFLNKSKNRNSVDHLTLSLGGKWDILPGLSFEPQVFLYKVASDGYAFTPSYLNGVNNLNTTRSASSSYSKQTQYQTNAILDYKKTFAANHNLDWMVGFSYIGIQDFSLSASGNGAATDLIPTLNASSTPVSVNGNQSGQALVGYFSRLNYNYKQKYLLSLTGRFDGASNLGADHKWGFFPGASVGWKVNEEKFWDPLKDFMSLKLRASYGVTGNISGLGDFQSQGAYSVGSFYNGSSAIVNSIIANPDLEWERSKTLDIGADLGFFNARGHVIFDYYRRVTDHLLTTLSLPPSTGFTGIYTNLGSLENRGVEVEVDFQVLPSSSNFQWNISFNAARTKNKILKLPDNGTPHNRIGGFYVYDQKANAYDWQGGLQEGGTLGNLFAWKQIGIYPTDKDASTAPVDMTMPFADKTKYGGDVNYADKDGNDTIDTRDLYYMGQPYPVWTGGMTNSFSYKNFNLLVRVDYMTGFTIYNQAKIFLSGGWSTVSFPQDMVTKGWHKQGDKAEYPQYVDGTGNYSYWRGSQNYNNHTTNSMFYEPGDFLCVREVTLSYSVPIQSLTKSVVKDLEFNITGSNLYYFTKYDGMSPEEGGVDAGRYPMPRELTIGATVSF